MPNAQVPLENSEQTFRITPNEVGHNFKAVPGAEVFENPLEARQTHFVLILGGGGDEGGGGGGGERGGGGGSVVGSVGVVGYVDGGAGVVGDGGGGGG